MTGVKIDVHQHFWKYNQTDYSWIHDSLSALKRDFLPDDLHNEMTKVRYSGSIAVQARQTEEETVWLLELAAQNDFIKGIVGWLDLCHPSIEEKLDHFAKNPLFKGLRHVLQDESDDAFMLRDDFQNGISHLASRNLVYEIVIYPKHLSYTVELVKKFPDQVFIIDHIAKPRIKSREIAEWAKYMNQLAEFQNVYVKASGLVTEADWKLWVPDDFSSYLDVVWKAFGEDRIMIGSDWPSCLLAASYAQVMCLIEGYFEKYSPQVMNKIRGCKCSADIRSLIPNDKNHTVFYELIP
ncbi:MAG: amidohydrolase family protein [Bacteroidales bacterium]|nr:amidohydrolase family protein [Bacteroidales bacterium]